MIWLILYIICIIPSYWIIKWAFMRDLKIIKYNIKWELDDTIQCIVHSLFWPISVPVHIIYMIIINRKK